MVSNAVCDELCKCLLEFENSSAVVSFSKHLRYIDFDDYIRKRFCIDPKFKIVYKNNIDEGNMIVVRLFYNVIYAEIIPSFSVEYCPEFIKVCALQSTATAQMIPKLSKVDLFWDVFLFVVPIFLMTCFLISISKAFNSISYKNGEISVSTITHTIQFLLKDLDTKDIWIGFLSWSWTNLFIRRRLNPEIGNEAYAK